MKTLARSLAFRILNVFTIDGDRLSGNPLAVFEDGEGLTDAQMLALARQFNLSETTFILPPTQEATARVRIFTPDFEMPFAGHPTLGTAHVVRALKNAKDSLTLEMKAGVVSVTAAGDTWTLRTAKKPEVVDHPASAAELASMLRLPKNALSGPARWVDTGAEQLVIPLRSQELVKQARPDAEALRTLGYSEKRGEAMAYVWSPSREKNIMVTILARFFFLSGGGVVEDPATGSACANLGGYFVAADAPLPVRAVVYQGESVARPSRLRLHVDTDRNILVGGDVIELGRGTLEI